MESVVIWALKGSLFLSVLALGLRATARDATHLLRRPEALARAILSMNGVMTLVAVVMIASFDLRPVVKLALAAIAVSPVPPILPRKALHAGCQASYTLGLLVAAALSSIVLIPLSMKGLQALFDVPLRMPVINVAILTVATILLPLALGLALRHRFPSFSERLARPLNTLSMAVIVVAFVPLLIVTRADIFQLFGNGTLLAFFAFSVIGLAVGHWLGRPEGANGVALALSTSARHPGMAVAIALTNYPEAHLAPAAVLLYFLMTTIVSAAYLAWWKRARTVASARREQH